MAIWLIIVVCSLIISVILANKYNRSAIGWALTTILFGPIPLLILLALGKKEPEPIPIVTSYQDEPYEDEKGFRYPDTKKCPDCAEEIKWEAIVCRFCGRKFTPEEVEAQNKSWRDKIQQDESPKCCPQCGGDLMTAIIEHGSWGLWCEHCQKSLVEIRKARATAST